MKQHLVVLPQDPRPESWNFLVIISCTASVVDPHLLPILHKIQRSNLLFSHTVETNSIFISIQCSSLLCSLLQYIFQASTKKINRHVYGMAIMQSYASIV